MHGSCQRQHVCMCGSVQRSVGLTVRLRVKGGTYYPITVKKHLRAQAIAQENSLPDIPIAVHKSID